MMFPAIDETRKQKFRKKCLNLYQNCSSNEMYAGDKFHPANGSPSPLILNNFDCDRLPSQRGHYLWRKATEALALPLLHVKVKEKQRLRANLIRQVTLKKLFITQVIAIYVYSI